MKRFQIREELCFEMKLFRSCSDAERWTLTETSDFLTTEVKILRDAFFWGDGVNLESRELPPKSVFAWKSKLFARKHNENPWRVVTERICGISLKCRCPWHFSDILQIRIRWRNWNFIVFQKTLPLGHWLIYAFSMLSTNISNYRFSSAGKFDLVQKFEKQKPYSMNIFINLMLVICFFANFPKLCGIAMRILKLSINHIACTNWIWKLDSIK